MGLKETRIGEIWRGRQQRMRGYEVTEDGGEA